MRLVVVVVLGLVVLVVAVVDVGVAEHQVLADLKELCDDGYRYVKKVEG